MTRFALVFVLSLAAIGPALACGMPSSYRLASALEEIDREELVRLQQEQARRELEARNLVAEVSSVPLGSLPRTTARKQTPDAPEVREPVRTAPAVQAAVATRLQPASVAGSHADAVAEWLRQMLTRPAPASLGDTGDTGDTASPATE